MGQILKELIKKHGYGFVIGAITLDGYRRTVTNDRNNQILDKIRSEAEAARAKADQAAQADYQKNLAEIHEKAKNSAVMGRYNEAADEHYTAANAYTKSPTEYRKNEVDRLKKKLDDSYSEVKELREASFFEYFNSLYNNYYEYLDSLTPDKIVCVFNIIIGG